MKKEELDEIKKKDNESLFKELEKWGTKMYDDNCADAYWNSQIELVGALMKEAAKRYFRFKKKI